MKEFNSQSGKSLLEVIIVVAVTAVLVTAAVARLGNSKSFVERQNFARELKISLERARFDSVKRRPTNTSDMSRVRIDSATSFTLITDFNLNGTLETAEARQINFNSQSGVKITGSSLTFPITMYFDRRGRVVDVNRAIITPTFIVCTDNCTSQTANPDNASVISISANGTVAMLNGGETQSTFQNPNVSVVNSNSQVNPWVTVSGEDPSTITTPITTASPTGVTCKRNEEPAKTGCKCQLPMTVRSNGQCK